MSAAKKIYGMIRVADFGPFSCPTEEAMQDIILADTRKAALILHAYVTDRCMNNRGDPQTDEYPEVWGAIISILKTHDLWDEKEHYPKAIGELAHIEGDATP